MGNDNDIIDDDDPTVEHLDNDIRKKLVDIHEFVYGPLVPRKQKKKTKKHDAGCNHHHCRCHRRSFFEDMIFYDWLCGGRRPRGSNTSTSSSNKAKDSKKGAISFMMVVLVITALLSSVVKLGYDAYMLYRLSKLTDEADRVAIARGGTIGLAYAEWKKSELPFWWSGVASAGLIALGALVLTGLLVFGVAFPMWVFWFVITPPLVAYAASYAIYMARGYKESNRKALYGIIDGIAPVRKHKNKRQ